MNFISVCSGIEAASVAFRPLGWKAIAFSEIEPFPCAVLAHHYPETPNMGDMSKFREWPEELFVQADVIVGGPPCQAFSIAGLRNGLNDEVPQEAGDHEAAADIGELLDKGRESGLHGLLPVRAADALGVSLRMRGLRTFTS